jgi:DNA polymerase-3 subunit epsilon/oligoribonuclease
VQGIFLDLESNGLDFRRHRVLEIAFKVINLMTGEEEGAYSSMVALSDEQWLQSDAQSLSVNGFTWALSLQGKELPQVSFEVQKTLVEARVRRGQSVFICQNPSFDRPFFSQIVDVYTQERLHWPYHWLDLASMYWALQLKQSKELDLRELPSMQSLSKDNIASACQLPKEECPHRAMQGVNHLILCYEALVGWPEGAEALAGASY